MHYQYDKDKLSSEEYSYLHDVERRIRKLDVSAMEEWATFFAVNRPDLVTDSIAKRIIRFYKIAVAKGNHRAMLNLGAVYYSGVITSRDFAKAIKLYEKAADSDNTDIAARAVCNLGYCYYYGRSIAVDKEKAFQYFLKGTLKYNDPNCLYKLGDLFRFGECIEKDEKMAYTLYKKAYSAYRNFDQCYADILVRLGECELYGIGTKKDAFSALKHLTLAEGRLYEKIYLKKDPFAKEVLAKTKGLIQTAERMLQGG